jgi:hypothetical protein
MPVSRARSGPQGRITPWTRGPYQRTPERTDPRIRTSIPAAVAIGAPGTVCESRTTTVHQRTLRGEACAAHRSFRRPEQFASSAEHLLTRRVHGR